MGKANEQQHTPGPWGIEQTANTNWIGPLRPDGKVHAIVSSTETGRNLSISARHRNDANANLIAASPDLLAELKGLVACIAETRGRTRPTRCLQPAPPSPKRKAVTNES